MMNSLLKASFLVLFASPFIVAQEPVPILAARWDRSVQKASNNEVSATGPGKPMLADNKYFQRKAREARTDNPQDPYETTVEGRSAAMEKAVQESRTPKGEDVKGYSYLAEVRNDTGQNVEVIFWEFQFVEKARPTNIIRRQFLCGVKIKKGEKKQLTAFSLLGPSDSIAVESLANPSEKLFEEYAQVNRIELSDGNILQRSDWKFSDVKKSVERVTSTPWGNEMCRAL